MKLIKVKTFLVALSLIFMFSTYSFFAQSINNQEQYSEEIIKPIYGSIILVGSGEIAPSVNAAFLYLSKEKEGKLVVIKKRKKKIEIPESWKNNIGNVVEIQIEEGKKLSSVQLKSLNTATAIWLDGDFSENEIILEFKPILKALLKREGVIGAQGKSAEILGAVFQRKNKILTGFNLLPRSFIWTQKDSIKFNTIIDKQPGIVGWNIPSQSAVIIHKDRDVSVLGYKEVTLKVSANGNWSSRSAKFKESVKLPYATDLISWNRSAFQRTRELFPPKIAPIPNVKNGALMIIGGSGYPVGMWERVVKFSGGKEANYVCISQSESSYGAKKLKGLGCKNVLVFHTKVGTDGIGQGETLKLIEAIKNADAVYFGGGRAYKFMDAYLNTTVQKEIIKLLERGGLVLGTSAGAQIQGDFLVRGNPKINKSIWMEGNDEGLGFLKGVIIDAHFRQRGRETKLPHLLVKHPQMLGIGIDEATAIFVQGTTAEVLGPNFVTFYDLSNYKRREVPIKKIGNPIILKNGEKYNLELRKKN